MSSITVLLLTMLAWDTEPGMRIRFATFNIFELSAAKIDEGLGERGAHPQLVKAAAIIQRVRPDVLLINEIDFDDSRRNAQRFHDRYLKFGQFGSMPIAYPHVFFAPVNTGVPTGLDLDHDGKTDGPADAFGYGKYPGQYGMALFSMYPLDVEKARTFQKFSWRDMPGHLMPDGANGKPKYYGAEAAAIMRLSSKSHWDIPVTTPIGVIHALCSHPTPPVFDGVEDHNGRRNFDEIRLWKDYLGPPASAQYIVDDAGVRGGLGADALFVIMGDLNAEPYKGDMAYGPTAIGQLLALANVADPRPTSKGAVEEKDAGPPLHFEERTHGFGRLDYVLPSAKLPVIGSRVFWPPTGDPRRILVDEPNPGSDHRLVWVDFAPPKP